MKCPVCTDAELTMSERQGIEIDYCPRCRGVWLDRGELDKIIQRAQAYESTPPPSPGPGGYSGKPYYDDDDDDDDDRRRRQYGQVPHGQPAPYGQPPAPGSPPPPPYPPQQYPYRKKKSFWSELFDD